ncbi:MAG: hypothetical protein J6O73_08380 [Lachnospiraceae bacterium]|nr:hypothetical protein [Lachnospiraceae bacterium]
MKKRTISRILTTMLSSTMIAAQMGTPINAMAAEEETIEVDETEVEEEDVAEYEDYELAEAGGVAINAGNFPDAAFREYINSNIDIITPDGILSEDEINNAYEIWIEQDSNLQSLKGIEYFSELGSLTVYDCGLKELDLTKNTKLYSVDCSNNDIRKLNLANPYLEFLYCESNELSSLDISNCPALARLECSDNMLTSIDISKNESLDVLECQYNMISTIDLSHNPKLSCLSCYANNISSLDISNVDMLKRVYNEGYDDTKNWLNIDMETPKKHFSGRPDAVFYQLNENTGTINFKWYLFAFDKSTQLILENNNNNDDNNGNDNGNSKVSDNTFSKEAAVNGVKILGNHTLKIDQNAQGSFAAAKILDQSGNIDKNVNSYIANIVTEYSADGTPKVFYSLIFRNGIWDLNYDTVKDGLYTYLGEQYSVAGGTVNLNVNSLTFTGDIDGWKYIILGHVVKNHAGLVAYGPAEDLHWFWIDNEGGCDTGYNAIVKWNGADFLVHGGRLRTDYTGFTYDPQNPSVWYHITNGQVWGNGVITDISIEGGTITRNVVNGVVQ